MISSVGLQRWSIQHDFTSITRDVDARANTVSIWIVGIAGLILPLREAVYKYYLCVRVVGNHGFGHSKRAYNTVSNLFCSSKARALNLPRE